MASGQVIGRHEVFEYTYRVGPEEERKRIKLVVIQRREQRRKSLIAASKYLERTPVRLRVNLHRAQYGDPEIISGSRHVPITLRRKVKAAPATVVRTAVPSPPPPEPTRIELVDRPVDLDAGPPPVVIIPPSHSPTPPPLEIEAPPLSRSSSAGSAKRPKVKRSGSLTSGFRGFSSLMGIIRRNSKSTTPPSAVHVDESSAVSGSYFDADVPRTAGSHTTIVEERESELGSPIATTARYGPPSVTESRLSHKPVPAIPESVASGRSRTWSVARKPSVSGSPRNKLVKASPRQVPLPDSIRQSDATGAGSPPVTGAFPVHVRQSAEYEPARSMTSRHTGERSVHAPEYTETYLHDSPTTQARSLHDGSSKSRSFHSEASARTFNRSLHDLSTHNRSAHDLSMRTPSRHSHEASVREGSLRDGIALREINGAHSPSLREPSVRDPSLREPSIRDPSLREHSLRGGGSIQGYHSPSLLSHSLHSPPMSMREVLSDGDRENDHTHDYERGSPLHSRVGSPSLHAPSSRVASPPLLPPLYREGSPSIHALSQRGGSPALLAPSHRGASPSLHAPSQRGDSPSLHAPSRGASPSLHAPSRHGSPPLHNGSPPTSLHAPSVRSRAAESVASSKYAMSSISGRLNGGFVRPKSPLSASESTNSSSRKTNTPRGPEITPVPMTAPSVVSQRTTASKIPIKSPLSRVASPPVSEAPAPIIPKVAPSVAGSQRSGRASEARTPRSNKNRKR